MIRDSRVGRWPRIIAVFMSWLLLLAGMAGFAGGTVEQASAQGGLSTVKIYPSEDAHVRGGSHADSNFGSSLNLNVKNYTPFQGDTREAYFKFQLGSVPLPVHSAALVFYGATSDQLVPESDIHVFASGSDTWTEQAITWNNKPARGASIGAAVTVNGTYAYRSTDVTAFVSQRWQQGGVASLILAQTASAGAFTVIHSRDAEHPAYLEITYESPVDREIEPASDAFVQGGGNANNNFGALQRLDVKNETGNPGVTRESFLSFLVAEDAGAIGKAELHLYGAVSDSGSNAADVAQMLYSVAPGWQEQSITWNNRPGYEDYLGTFTANDTAKWHIIDVTAYVKRQALSGQAASFGIRQEAQVGYLTRFNSREASSNKPLLKISSIRANEQAPRWPATAGIAVVDLDDEGVRMSWPPAEGANGVTGYRIYRNGELVHTVTGTTAAIGGLEPNGRYTFKVEAGDATGNWSQDGPLVTVTIPQTRLEQTKMGNVFMSREPAQFRIFTNRPFISWSVRNVWDEVVASGREAVAGGQHLLGAALNEVGHFTLLVEAESDYHAPIAMSTPFAVLQPYNFRAVEDSPFGINTHFERPARGWTPDLIQLIEYAGFKNVRAGIEWSEVERSPGVYAITALQDAYIDEMVSRKLNILMLLAYNNKFYDENSTPYTDAGRDGFANYGRFMLEYFGNKVGAYEIYNEFNIDFGRRGNGIANSRADYYYPLLKATYEKMKQANPNKTLVGMAASGVPVPWMEDVYALGGVQKLDVASVHPYQFPNTPEKLMPQVGNTGWIAADYNGGQPKPVWLTEIGVPSHTGSTGVDVKTQADYLVRTFVGALAAGAEKVYWYDLMNDGINPASSEQNFGLVYHQNDERGKHTPKPSYAAMGVLTRQLTGFTFAADESEGDALRQYKFAGSGNEIRVLWSVGSTRSAFIPSAAPVAVVDLMGNERVIQPDNGKVYLTLTDEPIYVMGAGNRAASNTLPVYTETVLLPVKDTYVHDGAYAQSNFGGEGQLLVKNNGNVNYGREALLSFDVAGVDEGFASAELYIYGLVNDSGGSMADNKVYGIDPNWSEAEATWNTKPVYRDYLATFRANNTAKWHAVDVTAYVKRQLQRDGQVSLGIRQEAPGGLLARFNSKEAETNKPYLKISGAAGSGEAPVWPVSASIQANDNRPEALTLSWPAATAANGAAGYRIYQNGQLIQTVAGTSAVVPGLAADRAYTFKVEAGDGTGNWSKDGPFVTVTKEQRLMPSQDSYAHGGDYAARNFGDYSSLYVKSHSTGNFARETFLSFDLSALTGKVDTAELYLYGRDTEDTGNIPLNYVYTVSPDWQENRITWNSRPAYGSLLGTFRSNYTLKWHVVDVTSYVNDQIQGNKTAAFGIRQQSSPGYLTRFSSSEAVHSSPYLRISQGMPAD